MTAAPPEWSRLAAAMAGEVVLRGEERMHLANKQFARALPLPLPDALLRCAEVDDVRRAIEFVRGRGIPFAVRSGGHCFGDLSSSDGAVIDLSLMGCVALEAEGERVRIGSGALSGEASRALAVRGRGVRTGGCPLVAIGGLALAGGFGFLGRRHGLVADAVTELEVVLAGGEVVRASAGEAADLFWALRGGGALGFGIVTELRLRTHALEELTAVNGRWPLSEAPELIEAWLAWAPEAPPAASLEIGLVCPDFLDEEPFVELFGIVLGSPRENASLLAEVQAWLGPLAADLRGWHLSSHDGADYCVGLLNHQAAPAWLPKRPYRDVGLQATRSHFFDRAPGGGAVRECVRRFGEDRRHAEYRELEFVPWGAAYGADDGTASFLHRSARLLVRHTATVGARSTAELRAHARDVVGTSFEALDGDSNGRAYQGYAEPERAGWAAACHGERLRRLREVRRRYDPEDLFTPP